MVLRDALPADGPCDARILATDIDTDMVARAAAGRYPSASAKPIPPRYRGRWVERGDDVVTVAPAVRGLITFKPLNLLEPWPMRGRFDAIFCRNVVIYFDKDEQRVLFDRFAELLADDGWLYIGHSESLFGVSERFELAGRTIYRKVA
jgi:chemotaxis protein methyltransferase CheR